MFIQTSSRRSPICAASRRRSAPNVWEEPDDKRFITPGHREAAKHLVSELMKAGFDMPYSYKMLHHEGLGHAFMNTLLYLDYDRTGWDYPIVPIAVNAYGRNVIRGKGMSGALFTSGEDRVRPAGPVTEALLRAGARGGEILQGQPVARRDRRLVQLVARLPD